MDSIDSYPTSYRAGCLEAYTWANAACDAVDEWTPKSRFCWGECNAALTSTSTGCDANNAIEAHAKTMADDDLLYCSSCEHLYNQFVDVCPDWGDFFEGGKGKRGGRMTRRLSEMDIIGGKGKGGVSPCDECNAAIKAVQTGCDAAKLDAYKLRLADSLLTAYGALYFSCIDLGNEGGGPGDGP